MNNAITKNTAAFIVEPIQGEAGVIIPDPDYLKMCEQICKQNNILLIMDEIQTGMGRSGKLLAYQHENIQPDGVLLGKALGGGLLPISLFLGKNHMMNVLQPGDHGSTFGGNPLASHVALEAINTLLDENLSENANNVGHYFLSQLKKINSHAIQAIRAKGLLIALQINPEVSTSDEVFKRLAKRGLLSINTRGNTIRLLPPLTITSQQIDQAIEIIQSVLE